MSERTGLVTIHGNPLTLVGDEVRVGQMAPDAVGLNTDLQDVALSSFRGKTVILSLVPSLDTPVCDVETRRFNLELGRANPDAVVVTVSMDLPFAQKRWCGAAGIDGVITLSDHRDAQFGRRFGFLLKELRLLARAILVLDEEGVIRYIQLVPEISQEPDYEAVWEATSG